MRSGVVLVALLGSACVHVEATMIGPARPAPEGRCQVRLVYADKPPYPHVDIASVHANCSISGQYGGVCIDELRNKACALGGDTLYGMSEVLRSGARNEVSATIAARASPSAAVTPPPPAHP